MDHVVYLDAKANELEKLLDGTKSMIIRGATGRKLPYARVDVGDTLYFINNNAEGVIKANAVVDSVLNSDKLSIEQSKELVESYQNKLNLTEQHIKKWAGKRYIVLIGIDKLQKVQPFSIDKTNFSNMDDWLLIRNIDLVRTITQ